MILPFLPTITAPECQLDAEDRSQNTNSVELEFANSAARTAALESIHALETNRAITVLVLLQPINTKYTSDSQLHFR